MRISHKVISALALALAAGSSAVSATTPMPSHGVANVDANARASGNRKDVAVTVGRRVFRTKWPAQVLKIYADGIGRHTVVGIRVSGVKFHVRLDRTGFIGEIASLAAQTLASSRAEEVDIYAVVPLSVGRGVVVAGDLAKPSSRTVFAVSVRRGESQKALVSRLSSGRLAYWDQDWARKFLK
ncbi:MAG: hypothetical protein M3Y18_01485 [Candidatus Eremiobacteraeota bacterium]|nr:hypothetical protein [Candidatus Eremiobacteraeota bacterium]